MPVLISGGTSCPGCRGGEGPGQREMEGAVSSLKVADSKREVGKE